MIVAAIGVALAAAVIAVPLGRSTVPDLQPELEQRRERITALESYLHAANDRIEELEQEVQASEQRATDLDSALNDERDQVAELEAALDEASNNTTAPAPTTPELAQPGNLSELLLQAGPLSGEEIETSSLTAVDVREARQRQRVWPVVVHVADVDDVGRIGGTLEYPSLGSVLTIRGQLVEDSINFRTVDEVENGEAEHPCEYAYTRTDAHLTGTWRCSMSGGTGVGWLALRPGIGPPY